MSIQAAIGRIDQIIQLRQQLTDPSLATSAATTATTPQTSSTGGASLAGSGQTFADQLATAQGAAATNATNPLAAGLGTVTGTASSSDPRVQAMVNEADSLLGKPYVYGGGHSGWSPQTGYDCSGFVSAVLHAGGYLSSPVDTTALPSQAGMQSGPGQYVTIYDRAQPGQSGHVIIQINGQFYESGGMHGAWGGGGGVEKIAQPSAAYLATFETILHPAGL
jgi:cell wall-associated NlpC family hydrolase